MHKSALACVVTFFARGDSFSARHLTVRTLVGYHTLVRGKTCDAEAERLVGYHTLVRHLTHLRYLTRLRYIARPTLLDTQIGNMPLHTRKLRA